MERKAQTLHSPYTRDNGSVVVPQRWAAFFVRGAVNELRAQLARAPRKQIADELLAVLEALQAAESLDDIERAAIGTVGSTVDASTNWVTVHEAATQLGRSERLTRKLAATGRIHARRVGARTWQIDLDSALNVLRRTA